jgi:gamma-glutamyltranspeptidase / glutathione hydrolase
MRSVHPLAAVALIIHLAMLPPLLSAASPLPLSGERAMVVASDPIAAEVGLQVLRRGGNAVDAAVAVAFALAVTLPMAGNIGGGGFMLVRRADGSVEAIDYRERAPLAATREMYLDAEGNVIRGASSLGHRAVAVPGTVAGLALAHRRHGSLRWAELVAPAEKIAREGFIVDPYLARVFQEESYLRRLKVTPETMRVFLQGGTRPYRTGERLVQPDLARTLGRIRQNGEREFYQGATAQRLVAEMASNGGLITMQDLAQYEPTIRQPLVGTYRGLQIVSMPPPSSGGVAVIQMLNMLEHFPIGEMGHNSAETLHLMIETMRRTYADRATHLADADFVEVPVARLTSKEYAAQLAGSIDRVRATPSLEIGSGVARQDRTRTTHFAVVDRHGNVVSNTYTLNDWFGSGVTVPGTGVLLNDEMDDFTSKPGAPNIWGLVQGEQNAIEPRKRPLSSMTPTIVLREGKPYMLLGSAGGPMIITAVLQLILNVVDHGMNARQAVDAARFHHQWLPDVVQWEVNGLNRDTRTALEAKGHLLAERPGHTEKFGYMADAHLIVIDPGGTITGAADPRRGGGVAGE